VLIGDRLGIAQRLRAGFAVGVHADLGPMETSQAVPAVPFNFSLFERGANDAFRQVVEIDRLALAPGKDVFAKGAGKIAEKLDITAAYVLGKVKEIIDHPGQQVSAVLKGAELLGKHLRLFGENSPGDGPELGIGQVPIRIITNVDPKSPGLDPKYDPEKAKGNQPAPIEQPRVEEKLVITVGNKLVN